MISQKVKSEVLATQALFSSMVAVFKYLQGKGLDRFAFWMERFAEFHGYTPEVAMEVADDYFGSKLTSAQCSDLIGIPYLHEVRASHMDIEHIDSFIAAYQSGALQEFSAFKKSVKIQVGRDVVMAYKRAYEKASNNDDKLKVLVEFGYDENDAKNFYIYTNHQPPWIDEARLAGLEV